VRDSEEGGLVPTGVAVAPGAQLEYMHASRSTRSLRQPHPGLPVGRSDSESKSVAAFLRLFSSCA
jgi:hypothetical protein